MAGRQRATFQKRQREAKRLEKQRMKAEKRSARRLEKAQSRVRPGFEGPDQSAEYDTPEDDAVPQLAGLGEMEEEHQG